MKKLILTAALAISTIGLFAQGSDQLISKKGEMYLPESGDWSISFSATPFLTYFGGLLSNNGAVAPVLGFTNGGQTVNQTIIGKYFVDNQTDYRGLLRIGINSQGIDNYVTANPTVPPATTQQYVKDHAAYAQHFIGLGAGYEKRKGKTRLQGYYGGEFMFFLSGASDTYTYGNSFDKNDQNLISTPWGGPLGITPAAGALTNSRPLSITQGSTFGINLQGFIGIEYFFMPKISVGGEYTWGITFASTTDGSVNTESANGTSSTTTTTNQGGGSLFSLDSGLNTVWGNSGGNLYINFHF